MKEIKFRAWNGKAMEYGGFCIHATGALIKDSALGDVFSESPVMQFTGLDDSHGMPIYEGDVVAYSDTSGSGRPRVFRPRAVKWYRDACNYNIQSPGGDSVLEVIGNIYENPELLEQSC